MKYKKTLIIAISAIIAAIIGAAATMFAQNPANTISNTQLLQTAPTTSTITITNTNSGGTTTIVGTNNNHKDMKDGER